MTPESGMSHVMADTELYEQDFYAWTKVQARKLRALGERRANLDLDLPHLAEEVEDLGKSERDAVRSQVRRIIEHYLKLEFSRSPEPRGGWRDSIIGARTRLDDKLTPTLLRDLEANLAKLYDQARERTENALRTYDENEAADALPTACPYALEDLMRRGWYPASRHAIVD